MTKKQVSQFFAAALMTCALAFGALGVEPQKSEQNQPPPKEPKVVPKEPKDQPPPRPNNPPRGGNDGKKGGKP